MSSIQGPTENQEPGNEREPGNQGRESLIVKLKEQRISCCGKWFHVPFISFENGNGREQRQRGVVAVQVQRQKDRENR